MIVFGLVYILLKLMFYATLGLTMESTGRLSSILKLLSQTTQKSGDPIGASIRRDQNAKNQY